MPTYLSNDRPGETVRGPRPARGTVDISPSRLLPGNPREMLRAVLDEVRAALA